MMSESGNISSDGANTSDGLLHFDDSDMYHIKWIDWLDETTPIITQNKNGPCPLLAIFNVLLLSRRINLSNMLEMISSKQILDHIGSVILEDMPTNLPEAEKLNYEQNMSDAIAVFAKLQTGIDVNVQFKSVSSFECTSEIAVFDLLRIPLYHGWLPDPQDHSAHSVLNQCSYNQIVDKIISSRDSTDAVVVQEGLIAQEFLNSTASQLTCYGVVKILETMDDRQLAVFFRNNHFSTVFKKGSELFTLVTDQGFLTKSNIVWETLSSVQGDTNFTDSNFISSPFESQVDETSNETTKSVKQIEQDFHIALSLQTEDTDSPSVNDDVAVSMNNADRLMAEELQKQFDREDELAIKRLQAQQQANQRQERSNDRCIIL